MRKLAKRCKYLKKPQVSLREILLATIIFGLVLSHGIRLLRFDNVNRNRLVFDGLEFQEWLKDVEPGAKSTGGESFAAFTERCDEFHVLVSDPFDPKLLEAARIGIRSTLNKDNWEILSERYNSDVFHFLVRRNNECCRVFCINITSPKDYQNSQATPLEARFLLIIFRERSSRSGYESDLGYSMTGCIGTQS
jgi:hypothetical protein